MRVVRLETKNNMAFMEKVDDLQEQMDNVSREMEKLRKNEEEW